MTVSFDEQIAALAEATTEYVWTRTKSVASSPSIVIVTLESTKADSSDFAPLSVTYGGVDMPLIGYAEGQVAPTRLYILQSPPAGVQDCVITFSNYGGYIYGLGEIVTYSGAISAVNPAYFNWGANDPIISISKTSNSTLHGYGRLTLTPYQVPSLTSAGTSINTWADNQCASAYQGPGGTGQLNWQYEDWEIGWATPNSNAVAVEMVPVGGGKRKIYFAAMPE